MSKRLHHKVRLSLFADNATGEYGMAPTDTIDNNYDIEFNSTWSGIMAFHDVFEHYCEHKHKWFMGDYAMNIAGEMFAMGHFYYYASVLGIHNRYRNQYRYVTNGEAMINSTIDMVQEAIEDGFTQFGNILTCKVPFQKDTHHYDFESYVGDYIYRIKQMRVKADSDSIEYAREYKKSVTASKITRLHRAGFYAAQSLVPDNNENRITLVNFIEFWDKFTKENKAEELYNAGLEHIDFELYIDDDVISWEAYGIMDIGITRERIKINKNFSMDDLYQTTINKE